MVKLESLPNELLLTLFEYIDDKQLLCEFSILNNRFKTLIFQCIQKYDIDFRLISKTYFNHICQRYLRLIDNRIISLHLSNEDQTPDLPNIFFSYNYNIFDFNHLQILSLYQICSIDLINKIIEQCFSNSSLIELNMIDCYFFYEINQMNYLINNIWRLPKLTSWKYNRPSCNGLYIEEISQISPTIKCISIDQTECNFSNLCHLLRYTPNLRKLKTMITNSIPDEECPILLTSIKSLYIDVNCSLSSIKSLFQNMQNLYDLTVITRSMCVDGFEWRNWLSNYLPKVKRLKLKMYINLNNENIQENKINQIVHSFKVHGFDVRCDWNSKSQTILYTIPYTFNDFIYFHGLRSESTCSNYTEYNSVKNLIFNDEMNSICFYKFPNINNLEVNFSMNNKFCSMIPYLENITSIKLTFIGRKFNFIELQNLFNRTHQLYSLCIAIDNFISVDDEFFTLSSRSIRKISFINKTRSTIQYLCKTEYDYLINSPLIHQCYHLCLGISYRCQIVELINKLIHLKSLVVQCNDEEAGLNDEIIEWLQAHLPSTYSIKQDTYSTSIRIWLDR